MVEPEFIGKVGTLNDFAILMESIVAIGAMLRSLSWQAFSARGLYYKLITAVIYGFSL